MKQSNDFAWRFTGWLRLESLEFPKREVEVFLRKDIARNAPLLYDLTSGFHYCQWHVGYIDTEVKGRLTFFKRTSLLTRGVPKVVSKILDYNEIIDLVPDYERIINI